MLMVLLVSGTLRSNLDPFGHHDDARLWDALRRSYLVEERRTSVTDVQDDDATLPGSRTPTARFTLDTTIEDEGGNLSVGQVRRFASRYRPRVCCLRMSLRRS